MSECSKYNLLISAYIDGELSEAEAEELKQHLDTCKDCRAYLKMLEAVSKQLGNTLIEPPKELKDGIMYKLSVEPKRKRQRYFSFGRYTVVAAVFCVVLLGAYKLLPMMASKSDGKNTNSYTLAGSSAEDAQTEGYGYSMDAGGADEAEMTNKAMGIEAPSADSDSEADSEGEESGRMLTAQAPVSAAMGKSGDEAKDLITNGSSARGYDIYKNLTYEEKFYSVSFIYGETPKELEDCEVLYTGEGETHYKVPVDVMMELEKDGIFEEIYWDKLTAEYGLVIVIPE